MGVELELAVLLAFAIIGQCCFARFEIETPPGRKIVKWSMMSRKFYELRGWPWPAERA